MLNKFCAVNPDGADAILQNGIPLDANECLTLLYRVLPVDTLSAAPVPCHDLHNTEESETKNTCEITSVSFSGGDTWT
ncbi:MAG: hypothetical protein CUN56_13660 [Phototrophicales bacterium]|nr:MAG: hypothetical protein CUN56_13660 [Phototrophicales bacterium]